MTTQKKPDVVENSALHYLYILGVIALVVGVIVGLIASFAGASSYGGLNLGSLTWSILGFGLAGSGVTAIIAGAVAQAVNWQLVNPRDFSQEKSWADYKADKN